MMVQGLGLTVFPAVVVLRDGLEIGRFCGLRPAGSMVEEVCAVLGVSVARLF